MGMVEDITLCPMVVVEGKERWLAVTLVKMPFEVLSQILPILPDTCTQRLEAKPQDQCANPSNH